MAGTTLPTPMYSLYAQRFHFAVLTTTVIFAVYAGGVLFSLLCFGRWSDAVGRRPMLLAGVVLAVFSAAAFLTADGVPQLLVGRALSGLSAGIFTGTATAAIIEATPPNRRTRAAAIATVANIGGLGFGPLLAGALVEYAPAPLHLTFVVHIGLALVAGIALSIVPETSGRSGQIGIQRLSVPPEVRGVFTVAALAGFCGFAVLGLFTAVAPSYVATFDIGNHAVAGLVVFSIFAASAAAQIAATRIAPQRAVALGCATTVVGMIVLAATLMLSSLIGLVAAAVVCGAGQGISFSRGLAAVAERTPADRRAEVTSTYFVVAYVAISLPVVGVGLAAGVWGLRAAGVSFTGAVAALASVCLAAIVVQNCGRTSLARATD
ncbi:MFS transporter [Mycobacterium sp. pW049]|uniref:MFS transporter n=1 Tax=[Mycobacterium] bulgaricum TaxID=3238985 RepID=UPI00351B5B65